MFGSLVQKSRFFAGFRSGEETEIMFGSNWD